MTWLTTKLLAAYALWLRRRCAALDVQVLAYIATIEARNRALTEANNAALLFLQDHGLDVDFRIRRLAAARLEGEL